VWLDPNYPEAHHAPAFRRYVERQATPVLVRRGSGPGGTVLFPSHMTAGQGLVEHASKLGPNMPTTLAEKAAAIGAVMSEAPGPGEIGAVTLTMADGATRTVAARVRVGS
jgi:hypothetical protein